MCPPCLSNIVIRQRADTWVRPYTEKMFTHLNNHSDYSLLNGMIRIPQLVKKTKEYGISSCALTDYGNIFGALEFYLEATKAGIKPIIGAVMFHPSHDDHTLRVLRRGVDHLFQLTLLICNKTGYQNLSRLMTRSYLEGFYYRPRIDFKMLEEYSEGLIALSGGWDGAINRYLFENNKDEAQKWMERYAKIFPGRFYLELQENGIEGQHDTNLELISLSKKSGFPVVATNNCHYLSRDESEAFEAMMCIQTGGTLHGGGDHLKFSTDGYYYKTPQEMEEAFSYCPEAISNTELVASQCNIDFDLKTYHFPKFDPPLGRTLNDFLKEKAFAGLDERWSEILKGRKLEQNDPKNAELKKIYQARLETELGVISQMGFAGYFLIVADFIGYAKNEGIPVGPGRGSAAGSLVAYTTRITDLDPLPYNLLFERFLNPERISMPDVDIDFCMNRREEVLRYVEKKYGNVSQIITFGKMKAKAVIRDVGRVLQIPYTEVDKIAKLVPNALNITLDEALKQEPRLKEISENDPQISRLIQIALKLEGLNRHASTHAAGVVISDRPLTDFVPLYKGSKEDIVSQFDMKAIEKIGLIKFDFLGLTTLTLIQNTLDLIFKTRGEKIKILEIPLDDPIVYKKLSEGDNGGVFQLESAGMKDLLTRLKPSCFEDLIALIALYRPGPMDLIPSFVDSKHGRVPITYEIEKLKPILEDTYGVIVYQEQVMQIASSLAGYSLGEADLLRRAMGKKKAEEMASQRERFVKGCLANKIQQAKAEKIFDLIAKFAEYGFNKSHSAAYALLSYQTAWLKTHYTVEYLTSILTAESGNTDKVLYYIGDATSHGLKVLPPDVNKSSFSFSVESPSEIRFGLGAVKNVGEGAIESILEVRKNVGAFLSLSQFCSLIDHRRVNKRVLESLVKAGAFDFINPKRGVLYAQLEPCVEAALRHQKEEASGQKNLFNLEANTYKKPAEVHASDWPARQKLSFEKEALGFYFSGHPLKTLEGELKDVMENDTETVKKITGEKEVTLAGVIAQHRVITTKKGSRMAFATLEDLKGQIEVVIFSDVFQKVADLMATEDPVVVKGKVDRATEEVKLIATDLLPLAKYFQQKTRSLHFYFPLSALNEERLSSFGRTLDEFAGPCPVYLHLKENSESETVMKIKHTVHLNDPDVLKEKVKTIFSGEKVEYRLM